jgi:rubrerythrin
LTGNNIKRNWLTKRKIKKKRKESPKMPRGELMLNPNQIHYQCSGCKIMFNGIPLDECPFCSKNHDLDRFVKPKKRNKFTEVEEKDYILW